MIQITNLCKQFKLYKKPSDRIKEAFLKRSYHHLYHALNDISFELNGGETLGILGKNGAGKSTLLKIINGVLLPDSGSVKIAGKVTALLELGTGFDMQLSGEQNIRTNGLLIGMREEEIEQQHEKIIQFSELGEYIHEPLRTYSSGMIMRLAFSIAIHAKPDCFLIDEALSVGDAHFQQKCMHHIREYRKNGGAIIFVSHDMNAVKMVCDRALVLDQGKIAYIGPAEQAVNHYNRIMAKLDALEQQTYSQTDDEKHQNFGNLKAEIMHASIHGEKSGVSTVSSGEQSQLEVKIKANQDIDSLTLGFMIRDRFGQDIYGTNTELLKQTIAVNKDQLYRCCFQFRCDIAPGKYSITIALHSEQEHIEDCYHWVDNLINFEVAGIDGHHFVGVCRLATDFKYTVEAV